VFVVLAHERRRIVHCNVTDAHLRRVLREYVAYYNADRTHVALDQDSPATRPVLPPRSRPGDRAAEGRWTPSSLRQTRRLTF
jgi:hypothetical protein